MTSALDYSYPNSGGGSLVNGGTPYSDPRQGGQNITVRITEPLTSYGNEIPVFRKRSSAVSPTLQAYEPVFGRRERPDHSDSGLRHGHASADLNGHIAIDPADAARIAGPNATNEQRMIAFKFLAEQKFKHDWSFLGTAHINHERPRGSASEATVRMGGKGPLMTSEKPVAFLQRLAYKCPKLDIDPVAWPPQQRDATEAERGDEIRNQSHVDGRRVPVWVPVDPADGIYERMVGLAGSIQAGDNNPEAARDIETLEVYQANLRISELFASVTQQALYNTEIEKWKKEGNETRESVVDLLARIADIDKFIDEMKTRPFGLQQMANKNYEDLISMLQILPNDPHLKNHGILRSALRACELHIRNNVFARLITAVYDAVDAGNAEAPALALRPSGPGEVDVMFTY